MFAPKPRANAFSLASIFFPCQQLSIGEETYPNSLRCFFSQLHSPGHFREILRSAPGGKCPNPLHGEPGDDGGQCQSAKHPEVLMAPPPPHPQTRQRQGSGAPFPSNRAPARMAASRRGPEAHTRPRRCVPGQRAGTEPPGAERSAWMWPTLGHPPCRAHLTCLLTLLSKHLRSSGHVSKHFMYLTSFNLPNNTVSKVGAVPPPRPHLTDREAEAPWQV